MPVERSLLLSFVFCINALYFFCLTHGLLVSTFAFIMWCFWSFPLLYLFYVVVLWDLFSHFLNYKELFTVRLNFGSGLFAVNGTARDKKPKDNVWIFAAAVEYPSCLQLLTAAHFLLPQCPTSRKLALVPKCQWGVSFPLCPNLTCSYPVCSRCCQETIL